MSTRTLSSSPTGLARNRQPLTVLQLIPELNTGGAELSAIEVCVALTARGDRCFVASQGGRLEPELRAAGGTLLPFPAKTKLPWALRANARKLVTLVKSHGVDIIHARSRAPAWSGLWAARWANVPFVTTYHGAYAERGPAKRLYNSVMARGDITIANSAYTRDLILSRYASPPERVRVVHRGVDLTAFDQAAISDEARSELRAAWGLAPEDRIILQAARLTDWKGQHVVIDAAAAFLSQQATIGDRANWVVVLAGDAQGREAYRQGLIDHATRLGIGDAVKLVGHCPQIATALAIADVTVVASTEPEAFGRAAAEAQAVGCPVIATNIGAPPETVRGQPDLPADERTGWLIPPNDPAELSAALAAAAALTPAERTAWQVRARAHISARFSTTRLQEATLAIYDELMPQRAA